MIDKTEQEIMSSWIGDRSSPVVSICSLAYNHEVYIADALDSFLMQETDFPFEILIHDDASIDNTANIIKEYEMKFPSIIKPIYQSENQYSQGIRPSLFVFEQVKGEFIAICEGDDYWCDPNKLKKQVALLKKYPKVNFSFHSSLRINMLEKKKVKSGDFSNVLENYKESIAETYENNIEASSCINRYETIVPIENIIYKQHYGGIETSSYMIRLNVLPTIIEFFREYPYVPVGDFYIEILASYPHGALYIDNIMSVYRLYSSQNSWSKKSLDKQKEISYYNSFIPSIQLMDKLTEFKYTQYYHNYFYTRMYQAFCRPLDKSFWYENYNEILQNVILFLKNTHSSYILYGYGTVGKYIYKEIKMQIKYIADKHLEVIDSSGKFISLEMLNDSYEKIIISPIATSDQIMKDLIDMGVEKNRLVDIRQFFPYYIEFIDKYIITQR